jgi:hypothetical protein
LDAFGVNPKDVSVMEAGALDIIPCYARVFQALGMEYPSFVVLEDIKKYY